MIWDSRQRRTRHVHVQNSYGYHLHFLKRKSMARLSVPPVRFLSTVITTPCASNDAQLSPNSLLSCNKRMTVNVTGSSLQDSPL